MKRHILKFTALILLFAVVFSCTGCFGLLGGSNSYDSYSSYTEPVNDYVFDFSLDTNCIAAGTQTTVCAYVYAPEAAGTVELWDDSACIMTMCDDGMYADAVADDGIYSASVGIITEPEEAGTTLYLHVRADGQASDSLGIEILGLPTAAEAAEAGDILEELGEIAYSAAENPSLQLQNALAYVDSLHSEGLIKNYYISDNIIGFIHSSGMRVNFEPYIPNTLAVGDGSGVLIATMDPYSDSPEFLTPLSMFSDGSRYIYSNENTYLTASAVADAFSNYYYDISTDLDVAEVTPGDVAGRFGPNMLILWQGHGGYDRDLGPFLGTGESFDADRYSSDPEYFGKFVSEQYLSLMDGRIGITTKFFNRNVENLSGSVIYLNACHSGADSRLADIFLSKGAQIVAGYTHSVYVPYASSMQYTVITKMAQINDNTGNYYSMQEALDFAHHNYGYTDLDAYSSQPGKVAAKVITYGGDPSDVYLARTGNTAAPAPDPTAAPLVPTPAPTIAPPAPTPARTPAPQQYSNYDAHEAYKQMLLNYAWVDYVPSDLSEIPPSEYDDYGMGSYYVSDIDNNGIDELVIKCGQSVADMSMTVFTYSNGNVIYSGSVGTGDAWLMEITNGKGAIIVEHHGGMGYDTYIDLDGLTLKVVRTEEYNYEQASYRDEKQNIAFAVNVYNVHDLSGL